MQLLVPLWWPHAPLALKLEMLSPGCSNASGLILRLPKGLWMRIFGFRLSKSRSICRQPFGSHTKLNVHAYDAYVIDCALKRDAPLISLDGGLLEACRRAKVEVIEVRE